MRRISCLALFGAFMALSCMLAVEAGATSIAQNSEWNVTRTGAEDTLRIVAYGDSIIAGYIDTSTIAQRASTHVAAEYGAALLGQNIEIRRRAQSGAVAQGIYNRIISSTDTAFMQTSNTRGVHVVMCGNDYLQARSNFAGQSGTCDYSGLETALANCMYYTELSLAYINAMAHPEAKLKMLGNLYYPGFDADNVQTGCVDPYTGESFNRRDKFLPLMAESNWETCNLADQYGWQCADNFAESMAADYDSNGDEIIDNEAIRYISGESKADYINRIVAAYEAGLLSDANFKEIGPSATVGYLLSDDTHMTYLGPTGKAGVYGGTPGGNVSVYHATDGAYPDGKNPSWNLNGHDRMGYALATNYDLNVNAGPDVTLSAGEIFQSQCTFNDKVFFGPWDIWVDYGDGTGESATITEMSFDLFNQYTAGGTYMVNVVVAGAYGTMWEDTLTVTVLGGDDPPNEAPIAVDDSYSVNEGETLSVPAPGVLANDMDPDGDHLTAVLYSAPTGGSLSLNADGSFTYTPNQGTTSDTFQYTASDGTAVSDPATVTITVITSGNQPPVAVDDFAETKRNVSVVIDMAANDEGNIRDASGNVSADQFTIVTPPNQRGTVELVTNGVNYTPRRNFTGTEIFTYTVSDFDGAVSNEATVTVSVTR